MKKEMSAFDVLRVVQEMQELIGGYLDKIFHWDKRNVLLRVNVPGVGRREVLLLDQRFLFLAKERPNIPEAPSQFAVHLRKLLSNARITSVRQHQFDRVVVLDVKKEEEYQVIIELFGDGNLLLVNQSKIINCLVSKTWKHRDVRPGASYEFPPARFNPLVKKVEDFKLAVQSSKSDLVRTLATVVNLGGLYAEEVCLRAGIDKAKKASEMSAEDLAAISRIALELVQQTATCQHGYLYMQNGEKPLDATPIPLLLYQSVKKHEFPSFSEALGYYLEKASLLQEMSVGNPEIQRLERQLTQLREAESKSRAEATELTKKAETLYSNYSEAQTILARLAELRGLDWDEVRQRVKGDAQIASIFPERREADILLAGIEIRVDYTKGLEENASLLYAQARDARDKAERSSQLIKETESKINELRQKEALQAQQERLEIKPTKQFWFEAYKWFFTSGGRLVLAGRDARTNDQLVKKHLTPADRYAHADVHGAPSVVIKEGASATEKELEEACAFALAHSKAWNAGIREGSAYWVLPDQVSKTPEAGEFVPRGAFVIRGKRNYVHHIQMELAVGEVQVQGARKVMCGPPSSLRSSSKYVVIIPGDMPRSKLSSSLAKELQVPEEEISRILPPGDVEIKERVGL
ncbi:MAG: ribosome rescue protein RqcH [Methanomassiliicoccales archaeon]